LCISASLTPRAPAGAEIESALAPGVTALKTCDPPLTALVGRRFERVERRGKLFVARLDGDLAIVIHLMSAGRLQLFETRASLRDRTSRLLIRLTDTDEPILDLFDGLTPENVEGLILDELADSALFALRFRQNAARALLLPRTKPGQRAPLWLQRLRGRGEDRRQETQRRQRQP